MADIRERIEFLKKNPQMRGFSPEQLDRIIDREKEKARFEQTQKPKPTATTATAMATPRTIPLIPKLKPTTVPTATTTATTATTAITTATAAVATTSQEEFYKKTIADLTKQLETAIGRVEAQPGTSVDVEKISRQSAYDFLYEQFSQYGLTSLVEDIRGLVESNVNPSEFTIRLRQTPAYKRRFAANDARIKAGLRALSEGEYIALEDQYQNILRNYGLPASYYAKDDIGRQEGFEKFIAGDVSPAEVEDRIQLGMNRVKNAAPEVEQTLRQFYPGITQSDILAYTLDPDKALTEIQRKIQAAEIGAEARRAGLTTGVTRAEELQRS